MTCSWGQLQSRYDILASVADVPSLHSGRQSLARYQKQSKKPQSRLSFKYSGTNRNNTDSVRVLTQKMWG